MASRSPYGYWRCSGGSTRRHRCAVRVGTQLIARLPTYTFAKVCARLSGTPFASPSAGSATNRPLRVRMLCRPDIYVSRRQCRVDPDDIPVCTCHPPKGDPPKNEDGTPRPDGCGEDCINRSVVCSVSMHLPLTPYASPERCSWSAIRRVALVASGVPIARCSWCRTLMSSPSRSGGLIYRRAAVPPSCLHCHEAQPPVCSEANKPAIGLEHLHEPISPAVLFFLLHFASSSCRLSRTIRADREPRMGLAFAACPYCGHFRH